MNKLYKNKDKHITNKDSKKDGWPEHNFPRHVIEYSDDAVNL